MPHQQRGIRLFEIERAVFAFRAQEHVAIGDAGAVEIEIEDALLVLHIHRQAFEAIGHLEARQRHRNAADLLEIGELPDFHAVAPHLPAQPPGAERRAFPVVLHEAEIVVQRVQPERAVAAQQQFLRVLRAGLHDDLILVVVLHPVGVLAIAAVGRAAAGLHIGGAPGLRPQGAQRGGGMERAGTHFHVVRLEQDAALAAPVLLQAQDQRLETGVVALHGVARGLGCGVRRRVKHRGTRRASQRHAGVPAEIAQASLAQGPERRCHRQHRPRPCRSGHRRARRRPGWSGCGAGGT